MQKKTILLTGNTTFKIVNFRIELIKVLMQRGYRIIVVSPADKYVKELKKIGCEHIELNMTRYGVSILDELRVVLSFIRIYRKTEPLAVLSYTIKNNIYSGLACRLLKIPFFPNVTGLGPGHNGSAFLKIIIKNLYKLSFVRAKCIFFQNDRDKNYFINNRLASPAAYQLLPGSGVNLLKFKYYWPADDRFDYDFLLASRLIKEKGIYEFIEAAKIFSAICPGATFGLIGPFDHGSKSSISKEDLSDMLKGSNVKYVGDTQDIYAVIKKTKCIVLPTYYNEGVPRILLEASATGRPLISTDIPGCAELIKESENGILIKPQNVQQLASAFSMLQNLDLSEVKKLGVNARQVAEQKFDEEFIISAYLKEIEKVDFCSKL